MAAQRLGWGLISWCRYKVTSHWEQGERERSRKKYLVKAHSSERLTSPVPHLYHLSARTWSVMFEEHGSGMSSTFFLLLETQEKGLKCFYTNIFYWQGWDGHSHLVVETLNMSSCSSTRYCAGLNLRHEPRTSRCSSWMWKRQRNERSNCQHL